MSAAFDRERLAAAAGGIAAAATEQLELLVGISTPSGDVEATEAAITAVTSMLPPGAERQRLPSSSDGFAPDLLATVRGSGQGRMLMLGHIDTVVPHAEHRPLSERDGRLVGSGAIDMKGGNVLALGVMRALAVHPELYSELSLLLVTDEEWRRIPLIHTHRFTGFDACLCFEAGEISAGGDDAVVVRRKAAAGLAIRAHGASAHAGAAPDDGANALLALAAAAETVAAHHDPAGPAGLTAVPTVVSSGEALNVVPAYGELLCDLRADDERAFELVRAGLPERVDGVALSSEFFRNWPGMDSERATVSLLARAAELLGRPIVGGERGGASDASYLAPHIPLTVDGLGPVGGAPHNPEEYLLAGSLLPRAEVALAVAAAAAELGGRPA